MPIIPLERLVRGRTSGDAQAWLEESYARQARSASRRQRLETTLRIDRLSTAAKAVIFAGVVVAIGLARAWLG